MTTGEPPVARVSLRENMHWVAIHAGHLVIALAMGIPQLCLLSSIRTGQSDMLVAIQERNTTHASEISELMALRDRLHSIDTKLDLVLEQTKAPK